MVRTIRIEIEISQNSKEGTVKEISRVIESMLEEGDQK
jgi:hypothetical protein